MEIQRPTELVDLFSVILLCAPDSYPHYDFLEKQETNASVFGEAFQALELFINSAPTEEGKERLRECLRNLQVAYEFYEKGDSVRGARFVEETEQMFQRCRRYIPISDE